MKLPLVPRDVLLSHRIVGLIQMKTKFTLLQIFSENKERNSVPWILHRHRWQRISLILSVLQISSNDFVMLDIFEKFMIRKGYSLCRLDGSTPMGTRQTLVDEFNNSPSKQVFLISTRAGGLGLNLVSANRVVIFDPNWNPAQDLQAQDRSFRYGQRRHVTVYRLLAAGSIEELVYTRQIYKQQLFNIGVSGTVEKRYFEGVQDSKLHKGELFGIANLFRDLLETVFTSDIIEKHDERITGIHRPNLECNPSSKSNQPKLTDEQNLSSKHVVHGEAEGGDISGLTNTHGSVGELEDDIEGSEVSAQSEVQSTSIDEIENNSQSQYESMLKDSDVVIQSAMAYYGPGDRVGGYPGGPEMGEDGPAYGRGYGPQGYVDNGYRRPYSGEYVGGAPQYYGPERPGGYGYGREGYGPSAYGQGYPQQQYIAPPPVEYVEPEASDLGMGLRDSHLVSRHHSTDYGAGYGPPDSAVYGAPGYGRSGYDDDEERRLRQELEHERRRKHEFEVATAAAVGYGLYERHEKNEAEEELERYEPGSEKHHHHHNLFRGEGGLD